MKKYIWEGNYLLGCGVTLTQAHIDAVPPSGPADSAIDDLRTLPEIRADLERIPADKLRDELKQYGAWDDAELVDHDANLARILWLAICDCREQPEDYAQEAQA